MDGTVLPQIQTAVTQNFCFKKLQEKEKCKRMMSLIQTEFQSYKDNQVNIAD